MISLESVTKTFNAGRPNEVQALRDVDLTVADRAITVLRGPSGSGKTTLLTLLGCMARPTSGRIHVGGRMVSGLPEAFLAEARRRTFGFVFQRFNLIRGLSVIENVMLPAVPLAPPPRALRARALARLAEVGLADKADTRVDVLSGGETQRAAIARALINDAPILIADEPTANLDTALAEGFLRMVADLRDHGRTVILSSHDPRIWDSPLVDRVVSMRDGRIEAAA